MALYCPQCGCGDEEESIGGCRNCHLQETGASVVTPSADEFLKFLNGENVAHEVAQDFMESATRHNRYDLNEQDISLLWEMDRAFS